MLGVHNQFEEMDSKNESMVESVSKGKQLQDFSIVNVVTLFYINGVQGKQRNIFCIGVLRFPIRSKAGGCISFNIRKPVLYSKLKIKFR